MPITVAWDDEDKTVIRIERAMPWNWADFDQSVDESYRMIRSVPHTVYTINVMQDRSMPQGMPLPHITRMLRNRPANSGTTVMVGQRKSNSFEDVLFGAVLKVYSRAAENAAYASSLDEARRIIDDIKQRKTQPAAEKR